MRAKVQGLISAARAPFTGMPAAGRPAAGGDEEKVGQLVALGFSASAAQHALRRCGGDLQAAAAWLLDAAHADERLAAEAQAAEGPVPGPPAGAGAGTGASANTGAPFLAPSALRPAGSEFAALAAGQSKDAEEPSEEALRHRLRTLLPEFGRELEECLAALSREELRDAAACLEAEVRARGLGQTAGEAAAPGGGGVQDGEEFFVRLEHRHGRPSGLVLDQQTFTVVDVTPGSSAASWNAANSDCAVRPGDTVWEVNGISEPQVMLSRLTAEVPVGGQDLMVGLRRPVTTAAVAAFRGSCTPATGTDFLLPQALRSQQLLQGAGGPPLRQWLPPIARGGSRRGSGAGLEGQLDEATAHFGRVDAAELAERLQAPEPAGAAALLPLAEARLPLHPEQLQEVEVLDDSEEGACQPGMIEVEPEAEETLADPATPAEASSREVPPEAAAGAIGEGAKQSTTDPVSTRQAEVLPASEEEPPDTSCLTMTFVEKPGTMAQLVVPATEAGASPTSRSGQALGADPVLLAAATPAAEAAEQGDALAAEDDSGQAQAPANKLADDLIQADAAPAQVSLEKLTQAEDSITAAGKSSTMAQTGVPHP